MKTQKVKVIEKGKEREFKITYKASNEDVYHFDFDWEIHFTDGTSNLYFSEQETINLDNDLEIEKVIAINELYKIHNYEPRQNELEFYSSIYIEVFNKKELKKMKKKQLKIILLVLISLLALVVLKNHIVISVRWQV